MTSKFKNKIYMKDSIVPIEEDMTHEFKGHRNLSAEEVPNWCWIPGTDRRSRKAISRNINGFLNTGKGGIIYLGIIDEGKVKGIPLCEYQKDHVIVAMKDLMTRYTPPVPEDKYKIEIFPVIQKDEMWKDKVAPIKPNSQEVDPDRLKPHLLRTNKYCWCDLISLENYSKGILCKEFVIEITVYPWTSPPLTYEDGSFHLDLHPIYQDEEGHCYFRRQASSVQYNLQEVVDLTVHEIQGHFLHILEELKLEANELKQHFQSHIEIENKRS